MAASDDRVARRSAKPSAKAERPAQVKRLRKRTRRARADAKESRAQSGVGRTRATEVATDALIAGAREARDRAVAPFSRFAVGAALETVDGLIITGCNIENASYGLTMCAERVAMFKAVSEGHRTFLRIAIVADTAAPTPPCGACRQILWEYAGDIELILVNLERETGRYRMRQLLPVPFDAGVLTSPAGGESARSAAARPRGQPPRKRTR